MNFKFPDATRRVSIVGRTGSGKTQFGVWLFSNFHLTARPHVMVDFKGDDLISRIDHAREIGVSDAIPKQPGLYVVRPRPDQTEDVENWLWKVWEKENTSLFFDEGYMINRNSGALNAILTQGRSKKIAAVILTQRPSYCSRFIFSEADYYAVFHLNDNRDYKTVSEFCPQNSVFDPDRRLPNYWCRWYDVPRDFSTLIKPAPSAEDILERYDAQLRPKVRKI